MWYEVLPPAAIMLVCISMPQYAAWYWNKAVFGNPFRRKMEDIHQRSMFTRDTRVGGAPWNAKGLENIPDGE